MTTKFILLIVVATAPLVGWLLLACLNYFIFVALTKTDLQPLGPQELETAVRTALTLGIVDPQWLTDSGFEPANVCRVVSLVQPTMVVWKLVGENTFLCVYLIPNGPTPVEFHTTLEDGELTTGSSKDNLMLPPWPGHWSQAFQTKNAAELYEHHRQALTYLEHDVGQRCDNRPKDIRTICLDEVRNGVALVRQKPFWPLRMPYWYMFLRAKRFNKSVQEQCEQLGLQMGPRRWVPLQSR